MDAKHFDRLARSLTNPSSRRGLLGGIVATLGLAALRFPASMEARKKRKNKNKKKQPAFNQFGCLNVGQKCGGNSANCCSGICQGKKPKKGQKDKSRCVGHDEGGCQAGQNAPFCGGDADVPCTTNTGFDGFCLVTTGNAAYCAAASVCFSCARDVDCQARFGGSTAACIPCSGCAEGTLCVDVGIPS